MDYGSGGRLCTDEMSSRGVWDDSIMESRFCGQVENGTPSTSPPYWDTDDDDDGPKPSALYGKFTWKIEKFSQINKRELRSNAFEVGGYKWYILIYPQGCDVCNHLSLFLCVANHDKLLPGWSHFAQFTIAVVNKDPKKSKYSDTLHRFCKKEHDWGWKKFIEISKVFDGFVNDDSLVIKAQVQVIREKANHPFRCLDCQYRRELVRVYLSNVEQICRRFIEDRKGKLCKLIDDKMRWSSFRAFWLGMDEKTKEQMSREKTDNILKVVVKNFFVEKEVTSTLVMDSLYSGLKALESQSRSKIKKGKMKLVEGEEKLPAPVVYSENNMFVLSDDVLLLVERAALGPIPLQPLTSKNEKGSLNSAKDANSGEDFNKDVIERDERRLTEFGLRTLEYYILFHIFSRIDVAHKEAVALKRQEELIREEEAAELAEIELKARRSAADKEKRAKKKQAKQKRNSRKIKDKTKDEIVNIILQDKHQVQNSPDEYLYEELSTNQEENIIENNCIEQNASETSDTADDLAETTQPDIEENSVNSVTNALEINSGVDANNILVQHEQVDKCTAAMDDSSSTCSSETIPSVVMNGSHKGNSVKTSRSQYRGKNQMNKETCTKAFDDRGTKPESRPEPETVNLLTDEKKVKISKEESTSVPKEPRAEVTKTDAKPSFTSRTNTHSPKQTQNHSSENAPAPTLMKTPTKSPPESAHPKESISRPYSAPLIPPQRPSTISITPQPSSSSSSSSSSSLSRSISAAGRLGADPYPSPPFIPHSYRNAITGTNDASTTRPITFTYPHQNPAGPGLTFGSVNPMARHPQPRDEPDEFPHMDIIYDLLDEDRVAVTETEYYHNGYGYQHYYNQWPPYGLPYDHDDGRYGYNRYAYNARPGNTWPQNGL